MLILSPLVTINRKWLWDSVYIWQGRCTIRPRPERGTWLALRPRALPLVAVGWENLIRVVIDIVPRWTSRFGGDTAHGGGKSSWCFLRALSRNTKSDLKYVYRACSRTSCRWSSSQRIRCKRCLWRRGPPWKGRSCKRRAWWKFYGWSGMISSCFCGSAGSWLS